jgi:hypothetical protein
MGGLSTLSTLLFEIGFESTFPSPGLLLVLLPAVPLPLFVLLSDWR